MSPSELFVSLQTALQQCWDSNSKKSRSSEPWQDSEATKFFSHKLWLRSDEARKTASLRAHRQQSLYSPQPHRVVARNVDGLRTILLLKGLPQHDRVPVDPLYGKRLVQHPRTGRRQFGAKRKSVGTTAPVVQRQVDATGKATHTQHSGTDIILTQMSKNVCRFEALSSATGFCRFAAASAAHLPCAPSPLGGAFRFKSPSSCYDDTDRFSWFSLDFLGNVEGDPDALRGLGSRSTTATVG